MCRFHLNLTYSPVITRQLVAPTRFGRLVGKLRKYTGRLGPPPPRSTLGAKYFFLPYLHNGGNVVLRRLRGSQLSSRFTPSPGVAPGVLFWI